MNLFLNLKHKIAVLFSSFIKTSLKKKVLIIAILGLIIWLGRPLILGKTSSTPAYQTETVEKGTLITNITASGTITQGNSAPISTSATGIVNTVYVKNGDIVTQGQTIATITLDQSSAQKQAAAWASYLSAQNSLNAAKSKMNSLQSALFVANQKFVNGAGTKDPIFDDPTYIIQRADWQQAEADYTNQQGVISAAQASLTSSYLSYAQNAGTITAPMSGTISNLTLTNGVTLSSNNSSTTTTTSTQSYGSVIAHGATSNAVVNLSEIDVTKAKVGQKATLTLDAFPDKTFTGKVISIDTNGSVSSGVTTYPTTISLDTTVENMYPNMAVSAQIITSVKDDVVLVPSAAIQTSNDTSTVTILKNGKPTPVTVEIGDANDTQTEITSGISEGDVVVTNSTTPTSTTTTQTTVSPFGGTGFGGAAGGNAVFRTQRRQ